MMTLYKGSVKDVLGPLNHGSAPAVVFDYSDSYSVFDWGKMPDSLTGKGDALAVIAAEVFERLELPESWKEYSKTPDALLLRKNNKFGSSFNEVGEELQSRGLRTHYLGVIGKDSSAFFQDAPVQESRGLPIKRTGQMDESFRKILVKQVSVTKPALPTILGRTVADYSSTRLSTYPKLIPLEVVFRMGCPEGSSLLTRTKSDPSYLSQVGYSDLNVTPGAKWDFPLIELFTKLESTDRWVPYSEALAISSISASCMQDVLLKSMWVAGILRFWFSRLGLELADGKFEWAVEANGQCLLVDAIGPDEVRLLKDDLQVSKEFLRGFYRNTSWYESVERAKMHAAKLGVVDWKRFVKDTPPVLPAAHKELAEQVYVALANEFCEKKWFRQAWSLARVVETLKSL